MIDFAKEIFPINLEEEMKQSYLGYAMSVIVGRALPDVRDGLKPVHRRVLYAMNELHNDYNKPYKKSARVVGDTVGKYHPHGETAVYDTIVRMAQPFSMRYMLVDGQGNFGSVDGDSPAAMRYTEIRKARITHSMLEDIDKETVDFVPNYDGAEQEPSVLPARVPNLLVNGSSGIAVGMATNIPPHNLGETVNALIALIENPEIDLRGLMEHLPGPDFPTAGIINGAEGILEAYSTGRGRIYVRARYDIENFDNGRERIVVTELPYQVNKAGLLEKIAELVKEKKLEGISALRDESDKDGMRMVIELKRGEVCDVVINNLYTQTQMQIVFGINTVALVDGQPRVLTLKQILEYFLRHRREIVTRRTLFELAKARIRAHILEGLTVALSNIDVIIELIKAAPTPAEAKAQLLDRLWQSDTLITMLDRAGSESTRLDDLPEDYGMTDDGYRLTEKQAQAILDLRLQKLTGLEQDKILQEFEDILDKIAGFLDILSSGDRLMEVIYEELHTLKELFGDERRTEIIIDRMNLTNEDLIPREDMVVTFSYKGYAKSQPLEDYQAQRRGGRGRSATKTKNDDFIEKLFVANTHDTILCFSSRGRVYWLKVYQLPQGGRLARGRPLNNLLPLEEDERVNAVLPVKQYLEDHYVFLATSLGTVKKTPLKAFSRPLKSGIIAVKLRDEDYLVGVGITDGTKDVMLFSTQGKAIRFNESNVRPMGRTASGVRGIKLAEGHKVTSLLVADDDHKILTATENGFGKCTPVSQFPRRNRGGVGVISIRTSKRNGAQVAAVGVGDDDEIMLISDGGTLVRTAVSEVSVINRSAQGVRLIRLSDGEKLIGVEPVAGLDVEAES